MTTKLISQNSFLYICTISKLNLKKTPPIKIYQKYILESVIRQIMCGKKINNTKTKKIISSNIRIRELVNWKHLYYNYYHYFF